MVLAITTCSVHVKQNPHLPCYFFPLVYCLNLGTGKSIPSTLESTSPSDKTTLGAVGDIRAAFESMMLVGALQAAKPGDKSQIPWEYLAISY